jgi:hypothetical protein
VYAGGGSKSFVGVHTPGSCVLQGGQAGRWVFIRHACMLASSQAHKQANIQGDASAKQVCKKGMRRKAQPSLSQASAGKPGGLSCIAAVPCLTCPCVM